MATSFLKKDYADSYRDNRRILRGYRVKVQAVQIRTKP